MKEKEGVEMDKRQLLIEEYLDLANEIIHRNKPEMEKEFAGFTLNELEVIEHIGKIPDPNVTKLANASYMTRGAISKLTKKLIARGIINTYQSEENKKEIYFQLTPIGQKIRNRHEQLHQKWVQRDAAVFENMSKEEFSKLLGISGQYLGIVERGKSCLSIEKLKRLCDLTNTSADYILFGKNNNIKSETSKMLESFSNEEIELGCDTLKKLAVFIKSIN